MARQQGPASSHGASAAQSIAIVGGGPVGLVLALFLDRHGVPSIVFNREDSSRWHPKGNTHNSRTMEHYRRLGISQAIRRLGLPPGHPRDVAYFTRYNAWELARFALPSEAEAMALTASSSADHQVPEPLLRANQMYVERYLLEHACRRPNITLRFGWTATAWTADSQGVVVTAERSDGSDAASWRAAYLVGCDGGHSDVRRALGFGYRGPSAKEQAFLGGRMLSTYVRIPALHRDILRDRKGWLYNVVAPDLRMLLISLNGADEFLLMTKAAHPDATLDDASVVRAIQSGAGAAVDVTVLGQRAWTGGAALVAERFSEGRVFLAGDASHLFSPTGGFGLNTGIDGAANLAWKLAASVQGWAGPHLLDSYEIERRPVAYRNTSAARRLTERVGELVVPDNLEQPTAEGRAARQEVGAFLAGLRPQFTSLGVELGARYDGSPLVWGDAAPPADDLVEYRPSAVPGGRLPHLWLDADGAERCSLFDRLGVGFTVLRVGSDAPSADDFVAASAARGVPLDVREVPISPALDLFQRRLVLVRPDQHVAWRSDRSPEDAGAVLDRCRGASAQEPTLAVDRTMSAR